MPSIYRNIPIMKMSYLRPPQIKYLGINLGFQEEDMGKSLEKKLNYKYRITKMSYLPLHHKFIGYNTYIISRKFYRETMCPLTPNQIRMLEQSFIRQCHKVAHISMDTSKTSRKFGGFEMTGLNSQIRYIKAKYLNNILFEKEPSSVSESRKIDHQKFRVNYQPQSRSSYSNLGC